MKSGRSPLKQPPLRNPGESLQQLRDDYLNDKLLPFLLFTALLFILAGFEWALQTGRMPVSPKSTLVLAFLALAASVVQFFRVRKQMRIYNRGLAAEKAVGQFLEQFRARGYTVFHDIPVKAGEKAFNIDHLLIGPKGIFTIETKYRKKPLRGGCKVIYDGNQVSINGQAPDRDPIAQALGQTAWVRDYLKSCTALSAIPITPLVVFPGWYIDYLQAGDAKVKVANEQLIWSCIQSSPHRLAPHDAKLIESRLTDYIQRQTA